MRQLRIVYRSFGVRREVIRQVPQKWEELTPDQFLQVMHHLYEMGDKVFGPYGFYDAFSETADWYPKRYLAIDQGPIAVMIENYRTGLLWKLFMSHPDVQNGLKKLGFNVKK